MKLLYVHGINVPENPSGAPLYSDWNNAVSHALKKYGYDGPVTPIPAKYNDLFDPDPPNFLTYIEALTELIASLGQNEAVKQFAKLKGQQPEPQGLQTLNDLIRWTAGMVAQFVVDSDLRKQCRDVISELIQKKNPDVICAHSLGSIICYDLAIKNPAVFAGRTFITLGSQINNPFVRGRLWKHDFKMVKADFWHHLFNPNDPVFTANIQFPAATNFRWWTIRFGEKPPSLNLTAHWPTQQLDQYGKPIKPMHPGYLDDPCTAKHVWKSLAKKG